MAAAYGRTRFGAQREANLMWANKNVQIIIWIIMVFTFSSFFNSLFIVHSCLFCLITSKTFCFALLLCFKRRKLFCFLRLCVTRMSTITNVSRLCLHFFLLCFLLLHSYNFIITLFFPIKLMGSIGITVYLLINHGTFGDVKTSFFWEKSISRLTSITLNVFLG